MEHYAYVKYRKYPDGNFWCAAICNCGFESKPTLHILSEDAAIDHNFKNQEEK